MKKIRLIGFCVLLITLLVTGVNKFIFSLPDWVIRIDGCIMLMGILTVSYSTVKCLKGEAACDLKPIVDKSPLCNYNTYR